VRFVSSDPSLVLLSSDPQSAGSAELTFDLAPGRPTTAVYAYGLSDTGIGTIFASAIGFEPSAIPINLKSSGFTFLIQNPITIPAGGSTTIRIASGQSVRGGVGPVSVAIDNSNPAAVQTGAIIFQPGDSYKDFSITAKTPGTAILTIRDNGGVTNSSVLVVTVIP
jgi:hypothetical protein